MVSDRLEFEGPDALFEELQRVDPESAASMDPTKSQRLVRALEVYAATGLPLSHFHRLQGSRSHQFRLFVLNRDRRELYARIDRRVDQMLENGLLEEVSSLLEKGYGTMSNPLRTIGYQEPIAYLRGEISFDEMVDRIKRNSRRYAKRQLTWFRRDETNIWLDADRSREHLIEEILGLP
jgi:tRNA dimethylallyltransferase